MGRKNIYALVNLQVLGASYAGEVGHITSIIGAEF